MGTDVVASPQTQSPGVADAIKNSVWNDNPVTQQPTPAPTTVQQIPTPNPTQTPHNQITPAPTVPSIDATEAPNTPQIFTLTFIYTAVAGIAVALSVASIAVYRRKKH
jgi:hypothetical protein